MPTRYAHRNGGEGGVDVDLLDEFNGGLCHAPRGVPVGGQGMRWPVGHGHIVKADDGNLFRHLDADVEGEFLDEADRHQVTGAENRVDLRVAREQAAGGGPAVLVGGSTRTPRIPGECILLRLFPGSPVPERRCTGLNIDA
jgi:hypothetical protein